MKLDYSKTINEQQEVFDYYKNNYLSYQLEIERLKIIEEKYKDSQLYIQDFKGEIERLNNIINELEKWLEYQADHTMQQHNYYGVLDKLKELKENCK